MHRGALQTALVFCGLLGLLLGLPAEDGDQGAKVAKLISDLGHKENGVRDAAEKRLLQLSWRAFPAVSEAVRHQDPEVSQRARRIHERLTNATPEQLDKIQQGADEAFRNGRYEEAAEFYGLLVHQRSATVDTRLWLGHTLQMAERWQDAVDAYCIALVPPNNQPAPPETGGMGEVPWHAEGAGQRVFHRPVGGRIRGQELLPDQLRLMIGLIQRVEIGDLQAAATTFAEVIAGNPITCRATPELLADYEEHLRKQLAGEETRTDIDRLRKLHYPLCCLKELALTQEQAGDPSAALASWEKLRLIGLRHGQSKHDTHVMGRLVQKLDPDESTPTGSPLVMRPEVESYSLDLADPTSLVQAYAAHPSRDGRYWQFAFSPPPGQEFATLDISCDIEQFETGFGGQLQCWAKMEDRGYLDLAHIGWPRGKPLGRDIIAKHFDVPAGVSLIHVRAGSWRGKFTVHGLTVRSTIRPRRQDAATGPATVWIQSEALPKGGTLACEDRELRNETAYTDFESGEHVFFYALPDRNDAREVVANLLPGAHYGLFINLDSPFTSVSTDLRHFSARIGSVNGSSLIRLPDGRWLVAYTNQAPERDTAGIMLCTSDDLMTWGKPWLLPHNGICYSSTPSLTLADDGTIWLAWFSDRLNLDKRGTLGFRLWIASSRDGKTWSRPLPVGRETTNPSAGLQWLRSPDGKYWLLAGALATSGDSPGSIGELSPTGIQCEEGDQISAPHATWDSQGRMHIVYASSKGAIWSATSNDGKQWSAPQLVVAPQEGKRFEQPQIVMDGKRAAIVYENHSGAWLQRLTLDADGDDLTPGGPAIKITNHVIPLNGSRLTVTPDKHIVLLAGNDTVWLLDGRLDNVLQDPLLGQ